MPAQIYHLSSEGIKQEGRTALRQGVFVIVFSTMVGVGLPTWAGLIPLAGLWVAIPAVVAMFMYGLRRTQQLLQDRWDSFQTTLGPMSIVRRQTGVAEVEINREQVVQIQEKSTGLFLRTAEQRQALHIPTGLDGYAEVKSALQQWRTIERLSPRQDYRKGLDYALFVLFTVSLGVHFLATNGWSVSFAGAYVLLFLLYGQVKLHKNKQVDPRAKFRLWQRVGLVVIMVGLVVVRIYAAFSQTPMPWAWFQR